MLILHIEYSNCCRKGIRRAVYTKLHHNSIGSSVMLVRPHKQGTSKLALDVEPNKTAAFNHQTKSILSQIGSEKAF